MSKNFFGKIILFFLLLSSYSSQAQLFDTIATSFKSKPKFLFKFDTRNSFITSQKAKIFGVKIGFDYKETVKLGIGFNSLLTEINTTKDIRNGKNEMETVQARLRFFYVSPFFEYVFYKNKRWEHSIPIQLGFGNSRYEYTILDGTLFRENYKPVILYEPAMTTQYKFAPWAGIGVGLGYRVMLLNNREIDVNFNSPIYVLKLKIFLGDLYRTVFPKKKE